jgi:N-acetylglucosaminyl-diphospho-decaprenol L-rhamnosyltransferase
MGHSPSADAVAPAEHVQSSAQTGESAPTRLAAIIVYFRTPECLSSCLDALKQQTSRPDEILVVDNSSAVDGVDNRPAPGRDWEWVRADTNLGFGAACNLGARIARGDYLLFVNADVVLRRDACEQLRAVADANLRAAVVGPRIYGAEGEIELSARAFPSLATGILGRSSMLTKSLRAARRTPSGVSGALGHAGWVDWVSGACMLIRRGAFEDVRGFDEGYWMYWEDADICRRLKDLGWGAMLCIDATARHRTGSSGRSEHTIEAFHASAARYYERHVAKTATARKLARVILRVRMSLILHRHGSQAAH